jgi:methionyl-tRNA synthetase
MSKSRGTFLTGREFAELLDPELLRYYYAANLPHSMTDLDLDLKNLQDKINNELVSNVANLVYRTLSFLNRNLDSRVGTPLDKAFLEEVAAKAAEVKESFYGYNFREAVSKTLEISSLGNKYFQDNKPWELVKSDPERTRKVLTDCFNIVKTVTILVKPILPLFTEKVEKQLGLTDLKWSDIDRVIENHRIGEAKIVLRKIDPIVLKRPAEKPKKEDKAKPTGASSLDLRIAVVTDVHDHAGADKLWILCVDLGTEKRQLCAGLKPYYPKKEDLLGRHLVVVTNLKAARLRGELSQGMLLAADDGRTVGILTAPGSPPGAQVTVGSLSGAGAPEITMQGVTGLVMEARAGKAYVDGKALRTEKEIVRVDRGVEGKIR